MFQRHLLHFFLIILIILQIEFGAYFNIRTLKIRIRRTHPRATRWNVEIFGETNRLHSYAMENNVPKKSLASRAIYVIMNPWAARTPKKSGWDWMTFTPAHNSWMRTLKQFFLINLHFHQLLLSNIKCFG